MRKRHSVSNTYAAAKRIFKTPSKRTFILWSAKARKGAEGTGRGSNTSWSMAEARLVSACGSFGTAAWRCIRMLHGQPPLPHTGSTRRCLPPPDGGFV